MLPTSDNDLPSIFTVLSPLFIFSVSVSFARQPAVAGNPMTAPAVICMRSGCASFIFVNFPFVASRSILTSMAWLFHFSCVTRMPFAFSRSMIGAPSLVAKSHVTVTSSVTSRRSNLLGMNTGNRRRSLAVATYVLSILYTLPPSSSQWSSVLPL